MGATYDYPCLPSYHERLSKQLKKANKDCKRICWENKPQADRKHNFAMNSLPKSKVKKDKRISFKQSRSQPRDATNSKPLNLQEFVWFQKMSTNQKAEQQFLNIENPEKDQLMLKNWGQMICIKTED